MSKWIQTDILYNPIDKLTQGKININEWNTNRNIIDQKYTSNNINKYETTKRNNINDYVLEDFKLHDYQHHAQIKGAMRA